MNKFKKLVRTVCSALCASFLVTTVNAESDPVRVFKLNKLYDFLEKKNNRMKELNDKYYIGNDIRDYIEKDLLNGLLSDEVRSKGEHYLVLNENNNKFEVRNGFLEYDDDDNPEVFSNVYRDECVICQEEFEDGERILLTSCGHYFHVNCLDGWRKSGRSASAQCPFCRAVIGNEAGYVVDFKKQADQNAQPNNELNNNQIEQNIERNNEQDFNDQLNQMPVNEIENLANENGENENNRVYDDQNFEFEILNVGNVYDFCRYVGMDSVPNIAQEMLFGNGLIDKKLENLPAEVAFNMYQKNIYVNGTCSLCNKSISPNDNKPAVITDCNGDHCGIFHLGCLKYEAAKSDTNLRETLRKPGILVFSGKNLDALKNSLNGLREYLGMNQ